MQAGGVGYIYNEICSLWIVMIADWFLYLCSFLLYSLSSKIDNSTPSYKATPETIVSVPFDQAIHLLIQNRSEEELIKLRTAARRYEEGGTKKLSSWTWRGGAGRVRPHGSPVGGQCSSVFWVPTPCRRDTGCSRQPGQGGRREAAAGRSVLLLLIIYDAVYSLLR
jgi:hypothetical protein